MSDQEQVQQTEAQVTEPEVKTEVAATEQHEPSAIELKAMEMGWRPKEEFNGDEDDFIDAKEFVRRKPLFDKIEHQSKELKEVRKILESLQDHHTKVKETEFKRAYEYLKGQKKEALESGDTDRVVEIDEQLVDMKAARAAAETAERLPKAAQPHPDFVSWVDKNSWYAQDREMRAVADAIGVQYAEDHPELAPLEVLKHVTTKIKEKYPTKFSNPNRTKPAAVDGGSASAKPTKASDNFQLTEEEERGMRQFVRSGRLPKEQYIADIKAMRG